MNNYYWYKGLNSVKAREYLINGVSYKSFMVEIKEGLVVRKSYDSDTAAAKTIITKTTNILMFAEGQTVAQNSVTYFVKCSDGSFEKGYVNASAIDTSSANRKTLTIITMFGSVNIQYDVV
ncbi:MAG: hypothetical protein EOM87_09310 [Clostridia bacterium]|nr:hypothetical protein [Clostridia bacterium]